MSVVPRETGRGPLNVNVDFKALGAPFPRSGGRVKLGMEELAFEEGQRISLRNAQRYAPDGLFASKPLSPKQLARNVTESRTVGLLAGHLEGLGALLEVIGTGPARGLRDTNPFTASAAPAVDSLVVAIRRHDRAGVKKAASKLAGLGIGLTPSADDLLSGLMVCLVLGDRNGLRGIEASGLANAIVGSSKGRTSELSFEFLQQAASGRANEKIVRLVEAIYTGGASEVRRSTVDVISIGETSGTDSLVGVLLGADLALRSHPRPRLNHKTV